MATLDAYRPFDSGAGSTNLESEWRTMARLWCGQGVDMTYANGFLVYGDSTGRQVKVKTGRCWVDGFFGENTSEKTISLTTNTSGNSRIDLIVAQLNPTANTISIEVVQGTPAASPAIPSMTQSATGTYQIPLGYATLANNYTTVAAGNVTDYRQGSIGADSNGMLRPWRTAWGVVGTLTTTADTASITVPTALTPSTLTYTAIANRMYKLECSGNIINNTSNGLTGVQVTEGGTTLLSRYAAINNTAASTSLTAFVNLVGSSIPSAGSHTYTCKGDVSFAGTGTVKGAFSFNVVDVGPLAG